MNRAIGRALSNGVTLGFRPDRFGLAHVDNDTLLQPHADRSSWMLSSLADG
jgi:hypothetical protein